MGTVLDNRVLPKSNISNIDSYSKLLLPYSDRCNHHKYFNRLCLHDQLQFHPTTRAHQFHMASTKSICSKALVHLQLLNRNLEEQKTMIRNPNPCFHPLLCFLMALLAVQTLHQLSSEHSFSSDPRVPNLHYRHSYAVKRLVLIPENRAEFI